MSDVQEFLVLSEAEYNGMKTLASDKCIYEHMIEPKSYEDSLGYVIPGKAILAKLIKKGLCFITEEEPMEDGFQFSPTVELTDLGRSIIPNLDKYIK